MSLLDYYNYHGCTHCRELNATRNSQHYNLEISSWLERQLVQYISCCELPASRYSPTPCGGLNSPLGTLMDMCSDLTCFSLFMLSCLSIRVWRISWTMDLIPGSFTRDIRSSGSRNAEGNALVISTVLYLVATCWESHRDEGSSLVDYAEPETSEANLFMNVELFLS